MLARPETRSRLGSTGVPRRRPCRARSPSWRTSAWTADRASSVRRGRRLTFSTTGEVQLSDDANDVADADGAQARGAWRRTPRCRACRRRADRPIGNGAPFAIGNQTTIVDAGSGRAVPRASTTTRSATTRATSRSIVRVSRSPTADPGTGLRAGRLRGDRPFFASSHNWRIGIHLTWPTGRTHSTCPARTSR